MAEITWRITAFEDLTVHELYTLLALRVSVFVMEQDCPYQELDGKDQEALHLLGYDAHGTLVATSRSLPPGLAYPEASLGRVVTAPELRGTGLGKELMQRTLDLIRTRFGNVPIRIAAQEYLERFYGSFGFDTITASYLWDGIPHVDMIRPADP
ncbi:MAG: GNAT family N-acetyltransferase [Bacteroidota bacterium]